MIKGSEIFVIINKEIEGYYIATHDLDTIKVDPYTMDCYGTEKHPEFEVESGYDTDLETKFEISNKGQMATVTGIWASDYEEELDVEEYKVFLAEEIKLED